MSNWSIQSIPNSPNALTNDMALGSNGAAHVVWVNGSNYRYRYTMVAPVAQAKLASEDPNADDITAMTATAESARPAVAVHPNGTVFFAYVNGDPKAVFIKKLPPGGKWSTPQRVGTGWQTDLALDAQGLAIAYGIAGNLSLRWLDFNLSPQGNEVKIATDGNSHGPTVSLNPVTRNAHVAWECMQKGKRSILSVVVDRSGKIVKSAQLSASNAAGNSLNVMGIAALDGTLHYVWQENGLISIVKYLHQTGSNDPITTISMDLTCSNPSIALLNGQPAVAYHFVTITRRRKIVVIGNGQREIVDDGWFPTIRAGAALWIAYRHAPDPIEQRVACTPI